MAEGLTQAAAKTAKNAVEAVPDVGTVTEAVAEASEFVAEQAQDFAEFARQLSKVKVKFAAMGVVFGTAAGAAASFAIAYRRLEKKYERFASPEEVEEIRQATREYVMPDSAVKPPLDKVGEILETEGYKKIDGDVKIHEVVASMNALPSSTVIENVNIFNGASSDQIPPWDYSEERKHRTGLVPYVIHRDEFESTEMDFEKSTLTYFEGDDVLIDESSKIIDDIDSYVGLGNLERFGHGSGDPMIVFVCNEELEQKFEIVRSAGEYAKEVHGVEQDDELRHSDMRRRRPRGYADE